MTNLNTRIQNVNLLESRRVKKGKGFKSKSVFVPMYKTLSARELFPILRDKLLASRPEVGKKRGSYHRDKTGRKRYHGEPTPVYGAPTFRNVITEDGQHV